MNVEIIKKSKNLEEVEYRKLEIGEILNLPHIKIINDKSYTTKSYTAECAGTRKRHLRLKYQILNPMCEGKVIVKRPFGGVEGLPYVEAACDRCEFTKVEGLTPIIK